MYKRQPEHWLEYEVSFRVTKKTLPDIIVRNEKRMLQEAVDSLIDNGPVSYTHLDVYKRQALCRAGAALP